MNKIWQNLIYNGSYIRNYERAPKMNEQIKAREILLVREEGSPVNVSLEEALNMAHDGELDLVMVNENSNPPICKLIDYGKLQYKKKKQEQEAKKKQKGGDLKTIRFGFNTDDHDIDVRKEQAIRFLDKGDFVKIQVVGRGRELAYTDLAKIKVQKFIDSLSEHGAIEQPMRSVGPNIFVVLKPLK